MSTTPSLGLPLIAAAQAQKHVTHNEAIHALDALLFLNVLDRHLPTPPASPVAGARYIVAAGASGAWSGHAGKLACFLDGGWRFFGPKPGWIARLADENLVVVFDGSNWIDIVAAGGITVVQNLALLGLGTLADAVNPFAAKLNNVLWTARTVAEGGDGDLRYKLNKESASDTLSMLFQSGWSGRAEIGLIGDDDLTIKVSADGGTYRTAVTVNRNDGSVSHAEGSKFSAFLDFGQDYAAGAWRDLLFNNFRHNDQGDAAVAANVLTFTAPSGGHYLFGLSATYEAGSGPTKMQVGLSVNNGAPNADTIGTVGGATLVSGETQCRTTALLKLASGDTVGPRVFFTGATGRVLANENAFWGVRLS
jgi:hypothetical protein